MVIRTEPAANTQMLRGETVIIIYATEPTSSIVPDVIGKTVAEAEAKFKEANLNYSVEGSPEVLALDKKKQYIIITNPVAGTSVARKTSVKLYVGTKEDYQNGGTPTPTPPQAEIKTVVKGNGGTITGAGKYDLNTQVTLTATAAPGFKFEYWEDALGNIVTYSANYAFVVKESATYTAVFSPLPTTPPTNTPVPPPTNTPVPPPPTNTPVPPPGPGPEDQNNPGNEG